MTEAFYKYQSLFNSKQKVHILLSNNDLKNDPYKNMLKKMQGRVFKQ